jgi:hypothetical protein
MIAASQITPPDYHSAAPPITVLVLVLLAGVLIGIELLRAYDEPGTRAVRRRLAIGSAPLVVAGAAIVVLRLAPLVH